MRSLVVLGEPPLPEGGALGRCAVALLQGLAGNGVDVRAIAARQAYSLPGEPPADLAVEVVEVAPQPPGWRGRLRHLRRPLSDLATDAFLDRVAAAAVGADVVHLEGAETCWADERVVAPTLVHLHYRAGLDRPFEPPWRGAGRQRLLFAGLERAGIRRHHFLVANSPVVADTLRRAAPGADVVVAPLSLDPRRYRPAPLDGGPVAGIIGTASWPPTAAAMHRLVDRVWPLVRRAVPDATLRIAGRGTAALGLGTADGVEVVGEVASSDDFLHGLAVLVYPLDRGSGMKVKVLESLATGLPVVTTRCGAEGVVSNEGVVVAESDEELAAAAAAVLVDDAERRQRGAAARETFLHRYAPKPATLPLLALYERMRS